MSSTRASVIVVAVALAHAAAFAWYQRVDSTTVWTDQEGYRRLGDALARTGTFTRYPDAKAFVPEVLRTPGYPVFVAAVYRTLGRSQESVALAQALAFAAMCLFVMRMTLAAGAPRSAFAAGLMTALYSPFPYFGALVLSELWTAVLLTLATWRTVVAARRGKPSALAAAGVLLGLVALTRPAFVLLPVFVALALVFVDTRSLRRNIPGIAALMLAYAVTLAPWLAYNYVYLHRVTISPAGGIGRTVWEGSWQGVWAGRTQAALTSVAESDVSGPGLVERVQTLAQATHEDPVRMLEYIRQWRAVRAIWDTPTEPAARAAARIDADREYLRLGLENNRGQWFAWAYRRLGRGMILLWMGDIPIRFSDINGTSPMLVRSIWLIQGALVLLAAWGAVVLWRRGLHQEAILLITPLVYITLVHLPLTTEPRLSLPGKPVLLALAAIGLTAIVTSPETSGS
jgi:4-amino-4-deoxy-L-arabinose transferase-like glycosyltransferase